MYLFFSFSFIGRQVNAKLYFYSIVTIILVVFSFSPFHFVFLNLLCFVLLGKKTVILVQIMLNMCQQCVSKYPNMYALAGNRCFLILQLEIIYKSWVP